MSAFGEPRGEITPQHTAVGLRPAPRESMARQEPKEQLNSADVPIRTEFAPQSVITKDSREASTTGVAPARGEQAILEMLTPKELNEFREAGSVEEINRREEKRKKRGGFFAGLLRLLLRSFFQPKQGDKDNQNTQKLLDEVDSPLISHTDEEENK